MPRTCLVASLSIALLGACASSPNTGHLAHDGLDLIDSAATCDTTCDSDDVLHSSDFPATQQEAPFGGNQCLYPSSHCQGDLAVHCMDGYWVPRDCRLDGGICLQGECRIPDAPDAIDVPLEPDQPSDASDTTVEGTGGSPVDAGDDAPAEPGCVPDCTGRVCGSDGCLGICGFCPYGAVCTPYGTCCCSPLPDCAGKSCGPDGVGGFCGPPELEGKCANGLVCSKHGTCDPSPCQPDCAGRECGDGGCPDQPGACGECEEGEFCSDLLTCVSGPCTGVDLQLGTCVGSKWIHCVAAPDGTLLPVTVDCAYTPNMTCGWDAWEGRYGCVPAPPA